MPIAALAALLPLALAAGEGWDGFPAFVWRARHNQGPPPAELIAGFGGVDVKRGERAPWARELCAYVDFVAGRDALHLDADAPRWRSRWDRWVEERGEEGLAREPCLSDPATRAAHDATLAATLEQSRAARPLFLSIGDEISLTPSQGVPWDGCRSPHCRAAWTARARGPAEDGAAAAMPATDAVRRAWTAGDASQLGAWLDLRRFHRDVVEDEVERLARRARALAPDAPLAVLGAIGATPYGGLDLARIARAVDVIECYPGGDARADLETLLTTPGTRATRSLRTVFLADDSPAGAAWQVAEHLVRGGDGVVVWCDADLEERPEHAAALRAALAEARRLLPALGGARPAPAGVAVLRDDDARALAFLSEARLDGPSWPNRFPSWQARHGLVETAVDAWLALAEDLGFHPGVARLDALDVERFPVLVLPHVLVLDQADVAALEAFVSEGGALLVDGELGTHDRAGEPRAEDVLARLRRAHPERVVAASLDRYAERRLTLDPERRRALLPPAAWAALAAKGRAPAAIRSEDGLPWLATRRALADGSEIVAAVPNLRTAAERARLAAAEVALEPPPPGFELVVLAPRPEEDAAPSALVVPPGSALVYALVPR